MALTSSPRPRSRTDSARDRLNSTVRSVTQRARTAAAHDRARNRDDNDSNRSSSSAPAKPQPKTRSSRSGDTSALDRLLSERARSGGSFRSSVLADLYGIPEDGPRASRALQNFNGRQQRTILGR